MNSNNMEMEDTRLPELPADKLPRSDSGGFQSAKPDSTADLQAQVQNNLEDLTTSNGALLEPMI